MTPVIHPGAISDPTGTLIRKVVGILDGQGVAHAFTGAAALAYWGQPRATKDIDVVILERDPARLAKLLDALAAAGFSVPPGALEDFARSPQHSTGIVAALPNGARIVIELLAPKPGQEELTRRIIHRARKMPFGGPEETLRVVTSEDLVLYKLYLFRKGERPLETADLKDIDVILAMSTPGSFDFGYVRIALASLGLAPEELAERSRWFEKALRRHGVNKKPGDV